MVRGERWANRFHMPHLGVVSDSAADTIHEPTGNCTNKRFLFALFRCEFTDRFSWPSANRGIEQIDIVAI